MRKLIRKILREDEWDFVRDTEAKLVKGMYLCNNSKKFISGHTVITMVDESGQYGLPGRVYTTDLNTGNHYVDYLDSVMVWLKSGEWTICGPLNESNDMEWIENTNPVALGNDKPREGEYLVCLPGFSNISYTKRAGVPVLPYGGAGYEEGRVITVDRVSNYSAGQRGGYIVWPAGYPTDGIFDFALARI